MLKRNDVPNMEISTPKFQARNRNIKCFLCLGVEHITSQCPNKRTMIVHVNRDVIHESESDKVEADDDDVELFMARHALNVHIIEDETEQSN